MEPERLDRARTVEAIAADTAPGRPPWAGAVLVRYPPRGVGMAAGAAVGLPAAPAGGHGELLFPTVDAAGRSVGAGRRNRPCVTRLGIAPARGRPAWAGLPAPLAVRGPHTACRARRRSRCRETTPSWFQLPWPRSRACRFRPWIRVRSRRLRRALAPAICFTP